MAMYLEKTVTVKVISPVSYPISNKEIRNLIDYINVADAAFQVFHISKGKKVNINGERY